MSVQEKKSISEDRVAQRAKCSENTLKTSSSNLIHEIEMTYHFKPYKVDTVVDFTTSKSEDYSADESDGLSNKIRDWSQIAAACDNSNNSDKKKRKYGW